MQYFKREKLSVVLWLPEPQLSLISCDGGAQHLDLVWVSDQTKMPTVKKEHDQIPDDVDVLCISIQPRELGSVRCCPAASTYTSGLIISGGFLWFWFRHCLHSLSRGDQRFYSVAQHLLVISSSSCEVHHLCGKVKVN